MVARAVPTRLWSGAHQGRRRRRRVSVTVGPVGGPSAAARSGFRAECCGPVRNAGAARRAESRLLSRVPVSTTAPDRPSTACGGRAGATACPRPGRRHFADPDPAPTVRQRSEVAEGRSPLHLHCKETGCPDTRGTARSAPEPRWTSPRGRRVARHPDRPKGAAGPGHRRGQGPFPWNRPAGRRGREGCGCTRLGRAFDPVGRQRPVTPHASRGPVAGVGPGDRRGLVKGGLAREVPPPAVGPGREEWLRDVDARVLPRRRSLLLS